MQEHRAVSIHYCHHDVLWPMQLHGARAGDGAGASSSALRASSLLECSYPMRCACTLQVYFCPEIFSGRLQTSCLFRCDSRTLFGTLFGTFFSIRLVCALSVEFGVQQDMLGGLMHMRIEKEGDGMACVGLVPAWYFCSSYACEPHQT